MTITATSSGRRRSVTSCLIASSRGPSATAHKISALGGGVGAGIFVIAGAAVAWGAAGIALATARGALFGGVGVGSAGVELHADNKNTATAMIKNPNRQERQGLEKEIDALTFALFAAFAVKMNQRSRREVFVIRSSSS